MSPRQAGRQGTAWQQACRQPSPVLLRILEWLEPYTRVIILRLDKVTNARGIIITTITIITIIAIIDN